ncbi:microfibril-associated glycoprotein 4-like [Ochlerotatus camptorhynchus]|uniref:microfibril-associated glycoprotein 4-like n=1 Tax=Ochlerotatus camptorhynchus TaxID=644619 RepID=UPI0031D2CC99
MGRSVLIHLLILGLSGVCWATNANSAENNTGFGYELLLAKLDYLEYKLLELQVETKEQGESILVNQNKSRRELMEQASELLEQQRIFANHEKILNAIFELNPRKHPADNSKLLTAILNEPISDVPSTVISCVQEKSKKSGRYWMAPTDFPKFEVYCEQTLHGGGWIVIQNRFNGSVDFFRNWTDYRNGFGSLDGEFWLGLEKIHQLTSTRMHELLIYLEDHAGVQKYAKYENFSIGDENDQYALKTLESCSGTLGDSLTNYKGMKFSTFDKDNDEHSENCASIYHGGWWYKACHASNLNGPYKKGDNSDTMTWYSFHNKHHGLKASKMMIREI